MCFKMPVFATAIFVSFTLFITSGCLSPCEDDNCPPSLPVPEAYSPYAHFVEQVVAVVREVNASTGGQVKVQLPQAMEAELAALMDPTIAVISSDNPEVIVTDTIGPWSVGNVSGYTPVIVRHYLSDSLGEIKGTRQIELRDDLSSQLQEYFPPDGDHTKVAALGHMRGLLNGNDNFFYIYTLIANAVNLYEPDYSYVLGDMLFYGLPGEYEKLEEFFFGTLAEPNIYLMGNHEAKRPDDFTSYAGTPPLVISTDYVNLISLDSNASYDDLQAEFDQAYSLLQPNRATWVMTHHFVWQTPFGWTWPYATFSGAQFMELVEGKIDAVFAGDADIDIYKESPAPSMTIDAYRVGSFHKAHELINYDPPVGKPSLNQTPSPLYFALISVGADQTVRMKRVYVDVEEGHLYYGVPQPN